MKSAAGKTFRHSRRMPKPQCYVSGKRPILITLLGRSRVCFEAKWCRLRTRCDRLSIYLWHRQYYQRVCPWWPKPSMLHIIMCFSSILSHVKEISPLVYACVCRAIFRSKIWDLISFAYSPGVELLNTLNLWEAYPKVKNVPNKKKWNEFAREGLISFMAAPL